jgi:hypothetical protein
MRIPENTPQGLQTPLGARLLRQGEITGLQPGAGSVGPATSTAPVLNSDALPAARRTINQVLKSYFYWTSPRGSFQYDIMVTLILAFIFITPSLWNYGDKPTSTDSNTQPVMVTGDGANGLIVTVQASDVKASAGSPDATIKKALKKAMEPVLGDSISVVRWELSRDANGNPVAWKIWAHR